MSHSQDAVTPCDYRGLNAENAVCVKLFEGFTGSHRAFRWLIGFKVFL